MFYTHDPSLIFFGLPFMIIPFTLFECQAIIASRVVSGIVELPEPIIMKNELDNELKVFKETKS